MADKSVHPPHRRPAQGIRQFALCQQLRETLDNPGLPHARLAHQNQIVLPALQQDLRDFQHLRPGPIKGGKAPIAANSVKSRPNRRKAQSFFASTIPAPPKLKN